MAAAVRRVVRSPMATTELFLTHFGLDQIRDLPGLAELKASGLLDANLPPDFKVLRKPTDVAALMPDELPLEDDGDEDAQGSLALHEDDEDTIGEAEVEAEVVAEVEGDAAERNRE